MGSRISELPVYSQSVLIADGDGRFMERAVEVLEKEGFEVSSAASLNEILDFLETADSSPVLLIAQTLPDTTVIHVLTILSQRGIDIPVIVLKNPDDESLAARLMEKGAWHYLEKTVETFGVLPPMIRRALHHVSCSRTVASMEKKQRDTQWRLENIIEGANVGTWEWNVQTGETVFNEKWAGILGYTLSELAPTSVKTWEDLTHPEDVKQCMGLLEMHFSGILDHYDSLCRMKHKDGRWIWVRTRGRMAAKTKDGKPLLVFGIHTEVSDMVFAAEELKTSRDLLDATQKLAGVGGWEWSLTEKKLIWTDETFRIHGFEPDDNATPEDYFNRSLECYDPKDRPVIEDAFRKCATLGEPYSMELPFTTAKGERIWVLTMGKPVIKEGRIIKVIGNIMDITNRKRSEESIKSELEAQRKLDRANNRVEFILNAIDDGLWENNFKTGEYQYSEKMFTMLGYPPVSGKDGYDFLTDTLHPHDKAVLKTEIEKIMDGTIQSWGMIFRMMAADGTYRYIQTRGNCVARDEKGVGYHFAGVHTDITERKLAEDALRESEEKYRILIQGLPDIVIRFDRDLRPIFASDNVEEATGLKLSEIIGKLPEEIDLDEDIVSLWKTNVTNVFKTNRPIETEFVNIGSRGETIYNWRLFPEKGPDGTVRSVLSICRDITKHREIERNYQILFQEMLNGFALHEIICDNTGKPSDYRYLAVNPAFERMTGFKSETITGKTVLEAMPGTEPFWIETFGRVALTGEPVFVENFAREIGKYFEVTAFRPAPNQFACIFADITKRKKAEEQQSKLQDQLNQAQKMETVGRLAGGVAHDFNNMMGVILGHTEMIIDGLDPSDFIYAGLQEIRNAALRSAALTGQLLAFARKQTVAPKILDLNETMEGMLDMLRRLISENITLEWIPGANLQHVKMDPSQIDQILVNLCVNARDALGNSGKVVIETGMVSFGDDFRADHPDVLPGDYVFLSVKDNGCGMDRETMARLFEPFFTTKEVGKGTGLGLSTVYGIVKQNNGFIDVISAPNEGATFIIHFPGHVERDVPQSSAAPSGEINQGHETILLVEDDSAILKMTAMMLKSLGYHVITADSPGKAIHYAESESSPIHLLMTDVVMPDMNGRDLANRIIKIHPGIKRLFMSGYTANIIAHHGVIDEGVQFIQKPFSMKQLNKKIRSVLDRDNKQI
jgi:PAS domain S-box-containing protein